MILKAVAVLGGLFVVVIGGVAVTKYGKSLFGSDSGKMKLWMDENGTCRYEGRSSFLGSARSDQSDSAAEDAKTDSLCTKIFKNDTSGINWNKVEIYWKNAKTTYQNAKEKWEQINTASNLSS